jgi:hypothetical protein
MEFGPIGIKGAADHGVPPRHDPIEAPEQRHEWRLRDQHGDLSVRLAEQGGERHGKNLVIEIVADVQGPVAPVFRAARRDQRPHDAGGVVARFSEVSYGGAALIDQYVLRIGAVEIELSHIPPPVKNESRTMDSSAESAGKFR